VFIGDTEDRLHFFGGLRPHGGARHVIFRVARGVRVEIRLAVFVRRDHPLLAHDARERVKRLLKCLLGDTRWKHQRHVDRSPEPRGSPDVTPAECETASPNCRA
jgi:hypothetical protein